MKSQKREALRLPFNATFWRQIFLIGGPTSLLSAGFFAIEYSPKTSLDPFVVNGRTESGGDGVGDGRGGDNPLGIYTASFARLKAIRRGRYKQIQHILIPLFAADNS